MSSLWPWIAKGVNIRTGRIHHTREFLSIDRVVMIEIEVAPIPLQPENPLKDGSVGRVAARVRIQSIPAEFAAPRQPRIEPFAGSRIDWPGINLLRSFHLWGGEAILWPAFLHCSDAGSK